MKKRNHLKILSLWNSCGIPVDNSVFCVERLWNLFKTERIPQRFHKTINNFLTLFVKSFQYVIIEFHNSTMTTISLTKNNRQIIYINK